MKITVLGAGMVGSAIARDMAMGPEFDVVAVDISQTALEKLKKNTRTNVLQADLSANIETLIADSDLVISAVPGFMGFETLRRIIDAGKSAVDISFFEQDPFQLDELAKARNVTAVIDCGVAPGLCNILAGRVSSLLETTHRYVCYVGGLPAVRRRPYEYKAPFSPADVLQEYIRPARYVQNGRHIVKPALSDPELIDFPRVGTLEAFNTDGLRTLVRTMDIPDMREKTLRYPGHAALMRIFRDSGFFDTLPVEVDGNTVKPLSMTSKLLFDQWQLKDGEPEFTVMQVVLEGQEGGQKAVYRYDLFDRYDEKTRTSSMARTTGYTCTIVARQLLNGMVRHKGICPPEYIGRMTGCYEDLLAEYKKRNIFLQESVQKA